MLKDKLEKIQAEYSIPPDSILTVSKLNNYLSNSFRADNKLVNIFLLGEISNIFHSSSNHVFFDMKDDSAKISCVIFDCGNEHKELLGDGKEILIQGRVDYYERDGKASVKPDKIYPIGEGLLWMKLKKLIKKLRDEGLFKDEHKKAIPILPEKIGIVTSQGSDALRDIVNSIHVRLPNVDIYVYDAAVQGKGAAFQLCEGIKFFDELYPVDVIILGRGGGSLEDLMAFNEEVLARAIYIAKTPVITGIGHREDETIAGYTADFRAITPTAAGKQVVANKKEMSLQLDGLQRRLLTTYERFIRIKQQEAEIDQGKRLESKYKMAILVLIIVILSLIAWVIL